MSTVTRAALETALELTKDAAVKAGVTEADRWHLDIGSKTYGRAYRIWLADETYEAGRLSGFTNGEKSGHYTPVVHDYLGMTAREAIEALRTMRSAFLAVIWAGERS
jgi:hypothetical protein